MNNKKTTDTDLQLQLALAKELPELIEYTKELGRESKKIHWKSTFIEVTPREWDWIVRECEKKLSYVERVSFVTEFKAQSNLGSVLDMQKPLGNNAPLLT